MNNEDKIAKYVLDEAKRTDADPFQMAEAFYLGVVVRLKKMIGGPGPRNVVIGQADIVRTEPAPPYRPPAGTVDKFLNGPAPKRRHAPGLGHLEPTGYRPPPDAVAHILDKRDRPVFDNGKFADRRGYESGPTSKAALQEELARAAANTAKLKPPGE